MMAGMRCLVWLLLVLGLACGVGDGRAAVGTFLGGTSVQEFATTVTPASGGWRYAGYDRYAAYGTRVQEASAGGAPADRFRANSKEEDPTGLLNEGFRYRDLETGTFISRDPLGFVDGPNVYCYVGQNPWSAFDPEGLAVPRDRDQAQRHRDAILGAYDTAHEYMGRAIEVMSQGMRDGSGRTGEAWFEKAEFFSQAARYMSVELEVYERYRDAHGNCSDGVPNWWDPGCLGECTPEQIADTTYQARQTGAIGDSAIIQPTSLMETDMTFKFLDAGLTVSGVGAGVKALSAVSRKLFAGIGKAAAKGGVPATANYAQTYYREAFSADGVKKLSQIAGQPIGQIDDLVRALESGAVKPGQIPVDIITRGKNTLILNTRTSQALERAGIPRSQWNAVDRSGDSLFEGLLDGQLRRNQLSPAGTPLTFPE